MSVHDKNTLNQDMAKGQNPDGTMFVWLYINIYIEDPILLYLL